MIEVPNYTKLLPLVDKGETLPGKRGTYTS